MLYANKHTFPVAYTAFISFVSLELEPCPQLFSALKFITKAAVVIGKL
jgi:hypothetical protein